MNPERFEQWLRRTTLTMALLPAKNKAPATSPDFNGLQLDGFFE
jgi:hypothetical protein